MSRYDLEESLREFINETLEQSAHSHSYADEDHDHDAVPFEDKVLEYLGDGFTVGHGCRVQRAFETAVMRCVEAWMNNLDGSSGDAVRSMLRSVLLESKRKDPVAVLPILTHCITELHRIPVIDFTETTGAGDTTRHYTSVE